MPPGPPTSHFDLFNTPLRITFGTDSLLTYRIDLIIRSSRPIPSTFLSEKPFNTDDNNNHSCFWLLPILQHSDLIFYSIMIVVLLFFSEEKK